MQLGRAPRCSGGRTALPALLILAAASAAAAAGQWWWQNPWPQGNPLCGIWGSGPDDVYAVGAGGAILHYPDPRSARAARRD